MRNVFLLIVFPLFCGRQSHNEDHCTHSDLCRHKDREKEQNMRHICTIYIQICKYFVKINVVLEFIIWQKGNKCNVLT